MKPAMLTKTVFLILFLSLIACTNQRKKNTGDPGSVKPYPHIINMTEGFKNKTQIKLSDIADSIRYIVFSGNKEVLIGGVQSIQMATAIFILSQITWF